MASAEAAPAAPPVALRDHRWRWRDLIVGLAPLVLFGAIASAYGGGIRHSLPAWSWIPLAVPPLLWQLAWPLLVARRVPPAPGPRRLLVEAGWALLALPVALAAQVALLATLPRLLGPQAATNPFAPTFRDPEGYHRVALALLAVAAAPFAEETFFRGMLYNGLRQRIAAVPAALISGAAFGLMHPFGLLERACVAAVGTLLALLYEWRKTLVARILLHGLINALAFAVAADSAARTPMLGVRGEAAAKGCVLTEVVPGGSAAAAGLRVGDVVTHAGANSVRDPKDLTAIVRARAIGETFPVWYERGGEAGYVEVPLRPRP